MTSELSKVIVTCAIWLATAFILGVFFFRVTVTGNTTIVLGVLCGVPAVVGLAAALATAAIWRSGKS